MAKILDRVGREYVNKFGYKFKIIHYESSKDLDVQFENGYISKNRRMTEINKGGIDTPYRPTVYGKGYIGDGKYSPKTNKKAHKLWASMFQRCYGNLYRTYEQVDVFEEWYNFQVFAEWVENNYNEKLMKNWELDKDIICKNANIYSPDTCCFIPHIINVIFSIKANKKDGLPQGIYKRGKKYAVKFSIRGKFVKELLFLNIEDACFYYNKLKTQHLKSLIEEIKHIIDVKLYNILNNHTLYSNDDSIM
jgi:hypothetical protein